MPLFTVTTQSSRSTNQKDRLSRAIHAASIGEAGIDPNDIIVFFLETDRASGSFGGGQFAPPAAFA